MDMNIKGLESIPHFIWLLQGLVKLPVSMSKEPNSMVGMPVIRVYRNAQELQQSPLTCEARLPKTRNAPKRMDGDPNSRIATDEAVWAAAQHASSADTSAARHVVGAARERPSAAGSDFDSDSAENSPVWDFETTRESEPGEAAASQQPHSRCGLAQP